MGLGDKTIIRIILLLVAIWLALQIVGDVLDLVTNSVVAALLVILLILWYLDYI